MKIDIGVIPARSGSKGLKDKNLKKIGDLTLIENSVQSLLDSKAIQTIVVTSDSEHYLDSLRERYNQEIEIDKILLHHRNIEHARDNSEVDPMLISLMNELKGRLPVLETIGLFYPTSPLRTAIHVREAVDCFFTEQYESLLSVETFSDYIWKEEEGAISPINYDPMNRVSRQYHKTRYLRENKSIYLFYTENLVANKSRLTKYPGYYVMSKLASIDVDSQEDLTIANLIKGFED